MANVKITELTAATALAGTDVLPIVDVGADATKKVSVSDLLRNLPDGTASAPALAFADDQNTGVLSPGDNSLAFATSGTQRLVIDSSGNCGIGTASPQQFLHVHGTNGRIQITSTGTGSASGDGALFGYDGTDDLFINNREATNFKIFNNGSERLRIDSSGNIGIGTSSPDSLIHAQKSDFARLRLEGTNSTGTRIVDVVGESNNTEVWRLGKLSSSSSDFQINVGGTERLRIDSEGKTTIQGSGASNNPFEILTLKNTETSSSGQSIQINLETNRNNQQGVSKVKSIASDNSGTAILQFNSSQYRFKNQADTSTYATIDSSGRLLVGTSTSQTIGSNSHGLSQIVVNSNQPALTLSRFENAVAGPDLVLGKSRASSAGSYTVVQNGDSLGDVSFAGADGTDLVSVGARIKGEVDGTPGSNDMPGRLTFHTTADSASSPTERMRINSSGNVGINSTNPVADLVVSNGGASGIELQPEITTNTNRITNYNRSASSYNNFRLDAAQHEFLISGSEKARIDSSGRLLIGTSSSSATNTVVIQGHSGGSSGQGLVYLAKGSATPANGDQLGAIWFSDNTHTASAGVNAARDGGTWSGSSKPSRLVFSTTADGSSSPTERMRIANNGVISTCSTDAALVPSTTASAGTTVPLFSGRHSGTAGTPGSGTVSVQIYSNGNIENTNNSYSQYSDIKLKENIVDANSQWDDLKAIQIRNWNFKAETGYETHTQIGVVAQEIETVSPGLVYETPDVNDEGEDLGTVTKSVNYSVLYVKAVKALQEAMDRIETLEAKVAALEAQ